MKNWAVSGSVSGSVSAGTSQDRACMLSPDSDSTWMMLGSVSSVVDG